jgi:hypothetical protein
MLTGELPIGRFAPPSKKVQIDVRLDEVVLRALEKEPDLRYQQASEVKSHVETIVTTSRSIPGAAASRFERRLAIAIAVSRWTARVLGTLMLLVLALFVIGEGMPSIMSQPATVRVEFVGFFVMALGMAIGWKWEGWAALLIVAGEIEFHVVEGKLLLPGALDLPMIVGVLYGACWWMQSIQTSLKTTTLDAGAAPTSPRTISSAQPTGEPALGREALEQARLQLHGPAIGLVVTSVLNWLSIFVLLVTLMPFAAHEGVSPDIFFLAATVLAVGSAVILVGALRMQRLESLVLARLAGIAAMLIGPGYIIGWPVGIWSLVVLARPDVSTAFRNRQRDLQQKGVPAWVKKTLWSVLVVVGIAIIVRTFVFESFLATTIQSRGTLEPVDRKDIYAGAEGQVYEFGTDVRGEPIEYGSCVKKGQRLLRLRNLALTAQLIEIAGQVATERQHVDDVRHELNNNRRWKPGDEARLKGELAASERKLKSLQDQAAVVTAKVADLDVVSPIDGQIVTRDLKERLEGRPVQKGQLLLCVADPDGEWELDLQVPKDRVGSIDEALKTAADQRRVQIPVTYILATEPGTTRHGAVKEIEHSAGTAETDEGNVLVKVAIDKREIDPANLREGATVTAKVRFESKETQSLPAQKTDMQVVVPDASATADGTLRR